MGKNCISRLEIFSKLDKKPAKFTLILENYGSVPLRSNINPASQNVILAKEGELISLYCSFDGRPKPQQSWFREERSTSQLRPLVTNEVYQLSHNQLVIRRASSQNVGLFACIANNSASHDRFTTEVLIKSKIVLTVENIVVYYPVFIIIFKTFTYFMLSKEN